MATATRWIHPWMIAWFVILACGSAWAGGKGGPVLIDQKGALRGRVTPSDLPGFPVTIDTPGSYRLSSNLDLRGLPGAQNLTAIDVTVAADVDLDLGGFTIIGPTTCSGSGPAIVCMPTGTGFGVRGFLAHNGRVHDGTVRGMGSSGVVNTDVVERVRSIQNGSNGFTGVFDVRDCDAIQNHSIGISAGSDSTIMDSRTSGNGLTGIVAGGNSIVTGNVVTGNSFGMSLGGGTGFNGNVVNGNNVTTIGGVDMGNNICDGALGCP